MFYTPQSRPLFAPPIYRKKPLPAAQPPLSPQVEDDEAAAHAGLRQPQPMPNRTQPAAQVQALGQRHDAPQPAPGMRDEQLVKRHPVGEAHPQYDPTGERIPPNTIHEGANGFRLMKRSMDGTLEERWRHALLRPQEAAEWDRLRHGTELGQTGVKPQARAQLAAAVAFPTAASNAVQTPAGSAPLRPARGGMPVNGRAQGLPAPATTSNARQVEMARRATAAQATPARNMLDTLSATGRSKNEALDLARSALGIIAPSVTTFTPDATGTSYAIAPATRSTAEVSKPYAIYDAQKHRVVVQGDAQGGLGEPARHYLQNAASNKSPAQLPVYYPGNQEPYSAIEVQGLHQAGENAHKNTPGHSPERAAALSHAGLSPEAIQQQYQAGRLSYQQATALNQKFNGITEVDSTLHGSRQVFGAWANDPLNPRRDWWLHGTPEQRAVVINEYHDELARQAQGNLHADPDRIELLRRLALGDQKAEWKKAATPTPGQMPKDGPAGFERIPLKDGSHTLMPGGRWTVEDLAKAHENPVFAKATQAERDAVMNDIIGRSFAHASTRPGFDQAAYQRFHQTAQQAREKSAALKTWWDTGSDAYNFGGNVIAGVARPIIATATDSSLKDPNNEWRVPFGNVGEQAGYWGQQAKDLGQRWLPGSYAAGSKLDSNLESLRQDLIQGNFPVNDRARLEEWLAQRSKGLTEDQKGFYEAVQVKPDLGTDQGMAQHIYTHSNTLLHPGNAELMGKFMQTHDPAVWKELHQNLTRTPQRAETDRAQNKSLEESKMVNFMTNNFGGGDYKEHMPCHRQRQARWRWRISR